MMLMRRATRVTIGQRAREYVSIKVYNVFETFFVSVYTTLADKPLLLVLILRFHNDTNLLIRLYQRLYERFFGRRALLYNLDDVTNTAARRRWTQMDSIAFSSDVNCMLIAKLFQK